MANLKSCKPFAADPPNEVFKKSNGSAKHSDNQLTGGALHDPARRKRKADRQRALGFALASAAMLVWGLASSGTPREAKGDPGKTALSVSPQAPTRGAQQARPFRMPALGFYLRDLSKEELRERHLSFGVLVEDAAGLAGSSGVKANDIILAVNGKSVSSVARFWQRADRAGWKFKLVVKRQNEVITLSIDNTAAEAAR